jgi:hypothetical protein
MLAVFETPDSRVYLVMAVAGTALFLLRMVLMMVGHVHDGGLDGLHGSMDLHTGDVGGHTGDMGTHAEATSAPTPAPGFSHVPGAHAEQTEARGASTTSFQLLSLQTVLAFLMGFGWFGLACAEQWHLARPVAIMASLGFGFVMMLLAGTLTYYMRRLDRQAFYDVRSCVGTSGRVYLTIPEKGKGFGQVEVSCSGRRKIIQAASTGPGITSFTMVKIVGVDDLERLIVEPQE